MDMNEAAGPSSAHEADKKYLTVRQAAFIGVGAMAGAGISNGDLASRAPRTRRST